MFPRFDDLAEINSDRPSLCVYPSQGVVKVKDSAIVHHIYPQCSSPWSRLSQMFEGDSLSLSDCRSLLLSDSFDYSYVRDEGHIPPEYSLNPDLHEPLRHDHCPQMLKYEKKVESCFSSRQLVEEEERERQKEREREEEEEEERDICDDGGDDEERESERERGTTSNSYTTTRGSRTLTTASSVLGMRDRPSLHRLGTAQSRTSDMRRGSTRLGTARSDTSRIEIMEKRLEADLLQLRAHVPGIAARDRKRRNSEAVLSIPLSLSSLTSTPGSISTSLSPGRSRRDHTSNSLSLSPRRQRGRCASVFMPGREVGSGLPLSPPLEEEDGELSFLDSLLDRLQTNGERKVEEDALNLPDIDSDEEGEEGEEGEEEDEEVWDDDEGEEERERDGGDGKEEREKEQDQILEPVTATVKSKNGRSSLSLSPNHKKKNSRRPSLSPSPSTAARHVVRPPSTNPLSPSPSLTSTKRRTNGSQKQSQRRLSLSQSTQQQQNAQRKRRSSRSRSMRSSVSGWAYKKRLQAVWRLLGMTVEEKMAMVQKYTSPLFARTLKFAITMWEVAAKGIAAREQLLYEIRLFEQKASDPRRYFEAGRHGSFLEEEKKRKRLLLSLSLSTDHLSGLFLHLKQLNSDKVLYKGEIYEEKMGTQYTDILHSLEQSRKNNSLSLSPSPLTTPSLTHSLSPSSPNAYHSPEIEAAQRKRAAQREEMVRSLTHLQSKWKEIGERELTPLLLEDGSIFLPAVERYEVDEEEERERERAVLDHHLSLDPRYEVPLFVSSVMKREREREKKNAEDMTEWAKEEEESVREDDEGDDTVAIDPSQFHLRCSLELPIVEED